MRKSEELKLKTAVLKLQYDNLIKRYERHKRREAFIKKHLKEITPLSMDGWPRMKQMKDYRKWIDIVYKAKINGIYGLGTANCDVIMQLNRFAKEIKL